MRNRTFAAILLLAIATTLTACDHGDAHKGPLAPTPTPTVVPTPTAPRLIAFTDAATGFVTSDVWDAQDHVVQFNSDGELIWLADDTHLKGYPLTETRSLAAESLCQCWLEVRFGTTNGERRAYLTADYGHSNPGTLVSLDLTGGSLVMTQSDVYPPGSYTLSGVVTELTPTGLVPVEDVRVSRLYGGGWQEARTDSKGFYKIQGLYDRLDLVSAAKPGYQSFEERVGVYADTRLDIQLMKR